MLNEHNPEEKASGLAILPEQPEVRRQHGRWGALSDSAMV
jgi:hypothetical protein